MKDGGFQYPMFDYQMVNKLAPLLFAPLGRGISKVIRTLPLPLLSGKVHLGLLSTYYPKKWCGYTQLECSNKWNHGYTMVKQVVKHGETSVVQKKKSNI